MATVLFSAKPHQTRSVLLFGRSLSFFGWKREYKVSDEEAAILCKSDCFSLAEPVVTSPASVDPEPSPVVPEPEKVVGAIVEESVELDSQPPITQLEM